MTEHQSLLFPWWMQPLEDGYNNAQTEISRLRVLNEELVVLLEELHALVWGECPSLLNEDSGGSAELDLRIRAAIAKAKGEA